MGLLHQLLPATTRLYLRVWQRRCADFTGGQYRSFARNRQPNNPLPASIAVQQLISGGEGAANKVKNLEIAVRCLQGLIIEPGQHFSFWYLVGRPSARKGYCKSRSIVQGQVVAETGGGLCQLSGLIYLLALKAGLSVTERHAHSKDIYREAERFTPLGSDATVAYGYKDLRFTNTLSHPIRLQFAVAPQWLTGSVASSKPVAEKSIAFSYTKNGQLVEAVTLVDNVALCSSTYISLYTADA